MFGLCVSPELVPWEDCCAYDRAARENTRRSIHICPMLRALNVVRSKAERVSSLPLPFLLKSEVICKKSSTCDLPPYTGTKRATSGRAATMNLDVNGMLLGKIGIEASTYIAQNHHGQAPTSAPQRASCIAAPIENPIQYTFSMRPLRPMNAASIVPSFHWDKICDRPLAAELSRQFAAKLSVVYYFRFHFLSSHSRGLSTPLGQ